MNFEETNIEIRLAEAGDAAEIAVLLYKAFAEYEPQYTREAFAATTPSKDEILQRIRQRAVWVASYKNKIAGTVSIFFKEHGLYIRSMAVNPLVRQKGIGKALMEHVDEVAVENGSAYIILNTTPFLSHAIRL